MQHERYASLLSLSLLLGVCLTKVQLQSSPVGRVRNEAGVANFVVMNSACTPMLSQCFPRFSWLRKQQSRRDTVQAEDTAADWPDSLPEFGAHAALPVVSLVLAEAESAGSSATTQHSSEDVSKVASLEGGSFSASMPSKLRIPFPDLTFHELIGKGTFKAVYRGRWHSTNVAIVSMRRGGVVKEARIQQLIGNHPNIVQFYRWTTDACGNEFMVMEYAPVGSMDKLLLSRGKTLRTRQRLAICEQICSGMCELASVGVLHRDLAGRNILVASLDPVHVKVSDFGLAWIQQDGYSSTPDKPPSVPIRWSPPEVLTRSQWSEKSDVWSFGVTMWEIFSGGREPYAHSSDKQVFDSVVRLNVLSRPKRCPKEVYDLMLRCWHKEPCMRPSFADILQVFKGWRESCRLKQVPTKLLAEARKRRARHLPRERPVSPPPGLSVLPRPPAALLHVARRASQGEPDVPIVLENSLDVPGLHASRTDPLDCWSDALQPEPGPSADVMGAANTAPALPKWPGSPDIPKVDLIHIATNVSLSDDGSSSNQSRSNNLNAVEQLKSHSAPEEPPQPPSLREGQDQFRRKKDISLDYLIQLRAPASTVIAEPLHTIESSAGNAITLADTPEFVGYGPKQAAVSDSGALQRSAQRSAAQVQDTWGKYSVPLPASPASWRRLSRPVSRVPSSNSMATQLTGDLVSESHLSFEFEPPIDPMISLTTSFSLGRQSMRSDSLHLSELDRAEDDAYNSRLHWPGHGESSSGQHAETSLMLSGVNSNSNRGDTPERGQSRNGGMQSLSLVKSTTGPLKPESRAVPGLRAGLDCAARGPGSGAKDTFQGMGASCSSCALDAHVHTLSSQLRAEHHETVAPGMYGCTKHMPPSLQQATSPYVDLQLLVRAQANGAIRG